MRGYKFLSFAKNIDWSLSRKYNQRPIDHAKKSATDIIKITSKTVIRKTEKSTDNLVVIKSQIKLQRIHPRIIQRFFHKQKKNTKRKIYISRKKTSNYWWSKIKIMI